MKIKNCTAQLSLYRLSIPYCLRNATNNFKVNMRNAIYFMRICL